MSISNIYSHIENILRSMPKTRKLHVSYYRGKNSKSKVSGREKVMILKLVFFLYNKTGI